MSGQNGDRPRLSDRIYGDLDELAPTFNGEPSCTPMGKMLALDRDNWDCYRLMKQLMRDYEDGLIDRETFDQRQWELWDQSITITNRMNETFEGQVNAMIDDHYGGWAVGDQVRDIEVRPGRQFGYATVGEWVILCPGLTDRDVRIYSLLRMHCQPGNDRAFPSQKTIADMLGIKKTDGVGQSVARLSKIGAVDVEVENHSQGRRNVYYVHEAPPDGYDDGPRDRGDYYRQRGVTPSAGVTPPRGDTPRSEGGGDPQIGGDG